MKSDMVNPIPAKHEAPRIWFHRILSGKSARLNQVTILTNDNMPMVFPSTRPAMIPRLTGLKMAFDDLNCIDRL